jgi:hypothetical protein
LVLPGRQPVRALDWRALLALAVWLALPGLWEMVRAMVPVWMSPKLLWRALLLLLAAWVCPTVPLFPYHTVLTSSARPAVQP